MTSIIINCERLKECREKIQLSKQETAKRIGISQPAYLRYENGTRTPSIQVIKEIANLFHTSVDYLTGQTDVSDPDILIINKQEQPQLFTLIEQCSKTDPVQLEHLLHYLEKMPK